MMWQVCHDVAWWTGEVDKRHGARKDGSFFRADGFLIGNRLDIWLGDGRHPSSLIDGHGNAVFHTTLVVVRVNRDPLVHSSTPSGLEAAVSLLVLSLNQVKV